VGGGRRIKLKSDVFCRLMALLEAQKVLGVEDVMLNTLQKVSISMMSGPYSSADNPLHA